MSEPSILDAGGLFQIGEPEPARSTARRDGIALGIDLGTTNSLVAIAPRGASPRLLADAEGRTLLPSVVSYAGEVPTVGWSALPDRARAPRQVLSSVKRFMGRAAGDISFSHPYLVVEEHAAASSRADGPISGGGSSGGGGGVVRFDVGARRVTPTQVSAEILRALLQRAQAQITDDIVGAVVTVPAYFDDAQRQATKDAGRVAGLEVLRLLAEPTAAALAYGLDRGGEGLFAVYDLGGGTFDVSLLRLERGVFRVLATGGDTALGGDDFDREIEARLFEAAGIAEPTPSQQQGAAIAARRAKEALTDEMITAIDAPELALTGFELRRDTLEAWLEPWVRKTTRIARQVLRDASIEIGDLDGVVLVGGSTRVPLVRQRVSELIGRAPLTDLDPDAVVALGAAIQADVLAGHPREGVTLLDVVPLSLGIETMGGIVEKIIPRNATIPIAARQVFTNYAEAQTGMAFHVVQGEREMVADCRSLARFELRGLPRLPPSMARVEVTFQLDADALLTVSARELMTGVRQTIEVKPTYGLSGDEVEQMIEDSLETAQRDFDARNLAEARVELGRVALAVRRALLEAGEDPALCPPTERAAILAALTTADASLAATTAHVVDDARRGLERVSEAFARRRMERALVSGMSGRSIDDVEERVDDDSTLDERRGAHGAELISGGEA
jgi:molecular chaperone HscA